MRTCKHQKKNGSDLHGDDRLDSAPLDDYLLYLYSRRMGAGATSQSILEEKDRLSC